MNRDGEPLPLMSSSERESYCAWLERLAGTLRGSLPEKLRRYAQSIREGEW